MSLLNHNNPEKKKLLSRGAKVEAPNQVKRSDLSEKIPPKEKKTQVLTTVTTPVNIRVDNHIRNKIAALITLGHASSQKEMVERFINEYIETLDGDGLKRFNDLVKIYEEKDVTNYYKKGKK